MFLVQKLKGEEIAPKQKFRNSVQVLTFLRSTYQNSEDNNVKARASLIKAIRNRSEEDCYRIEKLMSHYKYFIDLKKKYGYQLFQNFCKELYYKRVEQGVEVIKIGKEGFTFYVILSGLVGIYIYQPKKLDHAIELNINKIPKKKNDASNIDYYNTDLFTQVEVNELQSGQSFGEMSLMDSSFRTTATVIAKETCEFACIDRKAFFEILGKYQQTELFDKLKFLKSLNFLSNWYEQDIKTISYHFIPIRLTKNDKIYVRNEKANGIYLVKTGIIDLIGVLKQKPKFIIDECDELLNLPKEVQIKEMVICNLNRGSIFGDEEFRGIQKREFTAVCSSLEGEVFFITKTELEKRLWWQESRDCLLELIQQSQEWREERIQILNDYEILKQVKKEDDIKLIDHVKRQQSLYENRKFLQGKQVPQKQVYSPPKVPTSINGLITKQQQLTCLNVDFFTPAASLNNSITDLEKAQESMSLEKKQKSKSTCWATLDVFERAKLLGLDNDYGLWKEKKRKEKLLSVRFNKKIGLINLGCSNPSSSKQLERPQTQQQMKRMSNPQISEIIVDDTHKPQSQGFILGSPMMSSARISVTQKSKRNFPSGFVNSCGLIRKQSSETQSTQITHDNILAQLAHSQLPKYIRPKPMTSEIKQRKSRIDPKSYFKNSMTPQLSSRVSSFKELECNFKRMVSQDIVEFGEIFKNK